MTIGNGKPRPDHDPGQKPGIRRSARQRLGHAEVAERIWISVGRFVGNVNAILKTLKEVVERRMPDRPSGAVVFEIALCDVCPVIGAIDENAVPRLVFRRQGLRSGSIPRFRSGEASVDINDDSPVVEEPVMDGLADREVRFGIHP